MFNDLSVTSSLVQREEKASPVHQKDPAQHPQESDSSGFSKWEGRELFREKHGFQRKRFVFMLSLKECLLKCFKKFHFLWYLAGPLRFLMQSGLRDDPGLLFVCVFTLINLMMNKPLWESVGVITDPLILR